MNNKILKIAFFSIFLAGSAHSQNNAISLKSGESADVGAVYWVKNCQSKLKQILGVEVLEGNNPALQLNVRDELVTASRQNCTEKVMGGVVYATAGQVTEKQKAIIKYRVKYETTEGPQQSTHSVQFDLYP
ncbi:MAG: hypothetical protein RSD57_14960 [Comamonas sp.]